MRVTVPKMNIFRGLCAVTYHTVTAFLVATGRCNAQPSYNALSKQSPVVAGNTHSDRSISLPSTC